MELKLIKTDENGFPESIISGDQVTEIFNAATKIQYVRRVGAASREKDNYKRERWSEQGHCIPEMGCCTKDQFDEISDILTKSGESFRLKIHYEDRVEYFTSVFCERRSILLQSNSCARHVFSAFL